MKKILLIATGGTLASAKTDAGLAPSLTASELLRHTPEVGNICYLDTIQILNLDSSNIKPSHWLMVAAAIRENYNNYDGFIITHGTDTLSYTAAMLSYLIQNPRKPVILTGAQKPITDETTDAKKNLCDSARVASSSTPGVYVVFGGSIIYATRAKKFSVYDFDGFKSVNIPVAGTVNNGIITLKENPAGDKEIFYDKLNPSVGYIKLIPGLNPDILEYMATNYSGLVIESYGMGGLPHLEGNNFLEKVKTIKPKIIVLSTQVVNSRTDLSLYSVGTKTAPYVLESFDMTTDAATAKLMWALGQSHDPGDIREMFYKKINHDINIVN